GEIVTIFGLDFGPAALTTLAINPVTRTAATTLSDTRVLFDGVAAPLIYVSPNQISAAVPYGVASKPSTRISIEYKGQLTNSIPVPVSLAEPALFTFDSSGRGPGALLNENGSVNTRDNPATKGSVVVLYGTGEGLTNPVVLDGKPSAVPLAKPRLPVRVRIAGREAELLYAGAAPGLIAGVLQVNVRIPNDCPSGAVPLQLLVGERFSPQDVTIAVQ
ncbi:MAG TPA: IPT/TIG domain-containing protein, partial [Bryobacteraceae bacterium]|nr:IPT/TIG domain-containing protein [Bryobacteraceae bacterium]